jgi:hypothetical protein
LLSVLVAKAQKERKDLYEIEEHKNIFGTKYIYDRQHTRNPLILQIPILQAKDSEASFEFLKYQNRKKLANILGILPTGLSIYALFNAKGVSDALYWSTAGATFLLSSYIDYKANQHLKNAVARYNFVIKSSHVSFEIEKLNQNHGTSMGVGFAHSF